ncbi:hypothetical protein V6Z11_A13G057500 [Gossypium hirsutum]
MNNCCMLYLHKSVEYPLDSSLDLGFFIGMEIKGVVAEIHKDKTLLLCQRPSL